MSDPLPRPLPLVWHDGAIVEPSTPIATATDHGLLLGDGVFETMVVRDRRPAMLDRHLRRLRRGLDRLDIVGAPDDATIIAAVDSLIDASGLDDARLRLTITAGPGSTPRERGDRPTTFLTIDRLAPAPATTSLMIMPWTRNERSPLAGIKATAWADNAFALRHAIAHGFDNALFLDTTGRLSECATANLFLVHGDEILTPSLASGCLAGTVRESLLDHRIAVERDLWPADLERADAVFITTSTTGIVPVERVDGMKFPVDSPAVERARLAVADD